MALSFSRTARTVPAMAIQHILHLRCIVCGEKYPPGNRYTCDKCGVTGILEVKYDYEKVAKTLTRHALAQRPWTHWRYEELLPVDFSLPLPSLHIGYTPVYHAERLGEWVGVRDLSIKDDGRNPSASFKDRASSVGVTRARSLKEAVGLRPSSFTKKAPRPSSFASAGASTTGVKPTWRRGRTTSSGRGRRAR